MKQITMSNLSIVFDGDQTTTGPAITQAMEAIKQINGVLQREPYGLAAQIAVRPEEVTVQTDYLDGDGNPLYTLDHWRSEVALGTTTLGYQEWAKSCGADVADTILESLHDVTAALENAVLHGNHAMTQADMVQRKQTVEAAKVILAANRKERQAQQS